MPAAMAGLLDESLAAHRQAQRLDPTLPTTVHHTYYMQGDYERALAAAGHVSDPFVAGVLWALGRDAEALASARREEERFASVPLMRAFSSALRATLEGKREEGIAAIERVRTSGFSDGEGLFYLSGIYARLEEPQRACEMLTRAIDAGFLCAPAFETDVYLTSLRATTDWQPLLDRVDHSAAARDERIRSCRRPRAAGIGDLNHEKHKANPKIAKQRLVVKEMIPRHRSHRAADRESKS